MIQADLAALVNQHGGFRHPGAWQQVVEQSGLAAAKKSFQPANRYGCRCFSPRSCKAIGWNRLRSTAKFIGQRRQIGYDQIGLRTELIERLTGAVDPEGRIAIVFAAHDVERVTGDETDLLLR